MSKVEQISIGTKLKHSTVVELHGSMCELRCACGKTFFRLASELSKHKHGGANCGCTSGNVKHLKSESPEYKTWGSMRSRCYTSSATSYPYYGGRGIRVCERWQEFNNFYEDMGPKPAPEYSLDRINPDGNYEPSNCRWATPLEQVANRRWRNMTVRSYQHRASKTAIYPNRGEVGGLAYVILGLVGEAGEVAEKYKKLIRGDNGTELTAEVRKEMIKEAGDVAWYLSQLAHELNISLEDIMAANLKKLEDRKKRKVLKGSGDNR